MYKRRCKLRNLTPRTGGKKLNSRKGQGLPIGRMGVRGSRDPELFRKPYPPLSLSLYVCTLPLPLPPSPSFLYPSFADRSPFLSLSPPPLSRAFKFISFRFDLRSLFVPPFFHIFSHLSSFSSSQASFPLSLPPFSISLAMFIHLVLPIARIGS